MDSAKVWLGAMATATGLGIGWIVPSPLMTLAGLAVGLAATNGYSKRHSP